MKIIERNEPEEKETKKTCYKCKSKFSYVPSDIQYDFRDGDYVICPVCKAFISVGYTPVNRMED